MKGTWGVIQELEVEADTRQALFGAMSIVAVEYSEIRFYQEFSFDTKPDENWESELDDKYAYINKYEQGKYYGGNCLILCPYAYTHDKSILKLPFPLDGAEEMTTFVENWLKKNAKYPEYVPDTDGNVNNGFRVDLRRMDKIRIIPTYIVYGK